MPMIEVKYSCYQCGIDKASVHVVSRSPREDVVEFVNRAALQCKADHDTRSPDCEIGRLDELMIPVPDTNQNVGIGEIPKPQ